MKILLFALSLCVAHSVLAQKSNDTIRFGRDGRIMSGSRLPSAYPGNVILDISAIKVPGSEFVHLIKKAADSTFPVASDSAFKEFYQFSKGIFPVWYKTLTGKSVLIYDTLNPYFPVAELPSTKFAVVVDSASQSSGQHAFLDLGKQGGKPKTFLIWRESFDNQIVSKHLKASRDYYKGVSPHTTTLIDSLSLVFRKSFPLIDRYLYQDSVRNCPPGADPPLTFQIGVVDQFVKVDAGISLLNNMFCKTVDDNREWIKRWLWLTGGDIRLNPFSTFNPNALIADLDAKIVASEKELALLSKYTECCNFGRLAYENATKKTDSLVTELDSQRKRKLKLASIAIEYQNWLKRVSVNRRLLYKGQVVGSTSEHIMWIHHFDASDKFRFMTPIGELPHLVAPQDEVIAMFHNVKYSDSLSLKATEEAYQPKTKVEQVLEPITGALKAAIPAAKALASAFGFSINVPSSRAAENYAVLSSKLLLDLKEKQQDIADIKDKIEEKEKAIRAPGFREQTVLRDEIKRDRIQLKALQQMVADSASKLISFITYDNRDQIANSIRGVLSHADLRDLERLLHQQSRSRFVQYLYTHRGVTDMVDYEIIVKNFQLAKKRIQWLLEQTIPVVEIDQLNEHIPDFKTILEYPEAKLEMVSSKKVRYEEFKNDNKSPDVARTYYKTETARWWPTVGVAYVPASRTGSVFNDSTGTFVSGNDFDNIEILAGVKFYPMSTNPFRDNATRRIIRDKFNESSNIARGNAHFVNTAFLTAGFGVRHKFLKNYYLGLGADLTPGLSFIAGINYIFQKHYELENSHIKNEIERPKGFLFFGLSVDPNIVTNLIGIFK